MAAGVLAHQKIIHWWVALPVCLTGVLAGDIVLYWVGHHFGEHILDWRLVRLVLSPTREVALLTSYRKHGVKIVLAARHILGLRAAAFLTAGIAEVPFWKFLAVDTAAAAVGVPVGFGVAFLFTDRLGQALSDVHRAERWLVLLVLLIVAIWVAAAAWKRTLRSRGPGGGVL